MPKLFESVCKICEKKFKAPLSNGAIRQYCSKTCSNRGNARKPKVFDYPERECEQCKKVYKPVSTQQKFCTKTCHAKFHYYKHIDRHKAYDKIKIRKNRLGLDIRDEHLGNPTKTTKWLWDGMGKWSEKYWPDITECLECNTNVYTHRSHGVCDYCYDKLRSRDEAQLKEIKKRSYHKAKERGKIMGRSVGKLWIGKAKDKEIPITPKIENILDNLERL